MAVTITGTQVQFPSNGNLEGFYTGSTWNNTSYAVGSYLACANAQGGWVVNNTSQTIYTTNGNTTAFYAGTPPSGTLYALAGTWRSRGSTSGSADFSWGFAGALYQRVA